MRIPILGQVNGSWNLRSWNWTSAQTVPGPAFTTLFSTITCSRRCSWISQSSAQSQRLHDQRVIFCLIKFEVAKREVKALKWYTKQENTLGIGSDKTKQLSKTPFSVRKAVQKTCLLPSLFMLLQQEDQSLNAGSHRVYMERKSVGVFYTLTLQIIQLPLHIRFTGKMHNFGCLKVTNQEFKLLNVTNIYL